MGSKVDLEKLTGQNDFNMWKIKMEALLITQGLGDAIDPVLKLEGSEASSSKTLEQAAEIDKKARSTIILSLGDSVIREVVKEKTVAGLWAKLENLYMTKSLARKKMFPNTERKSITIVSSTKNTVTSLETVLTSLPKLFVSYSISNILPSYLRTKMLN